MEETKRYLNLFANLLERPHAAARVRGSKDYPHIAGDVYFYQTGDGVLVAAEITGLPKGTQPCGEKIFAMHIHSGGKCSGDESDPFAEALAHYDPEGCPHPHHAGDLAPLFGNRGKAFQVFLTNRFSVYEIIGKTVIVHAGPDDFSSQPAGNAGAKIACGEIRAMSLF